jgi:sugar phosphate isomerase/epimerase
MNRRDFSKTLTLGTFAIISSKSFGTPAADINNRLALTTVNFRERFRQTATTTQYKPLLLTEVPQYFRERFGLHQVEFWSKHFESLEKSYLDELKKSLKKSKSKLINLQFDEEYQIGSRDNETRQKAIDLAMKWIDATKYLGCGSIRVNPGTGDVDLAIDSLKKINAACKKNGLVLMVENHFGMEMNPDVHLRIVKEAGDNVYTLPDFGNYPDSQRYENLKKIMPYAYLVSAKSIAFDANMNHTSYDFDRCMKIAEDSGFKGIYSVEQWSREPVKGNDEAMAEWTLNRIKKCLS